jgi:formaldehyde-activating enzyme involved in methanogenesis
MVGLMGQVTVEATDADVSSICVRMTAKGVADGVENAEASNKSLVACRASTLLSQSVSVSESRGKDVCVAGVVAEAVADAVAEAVAEVKADASVEEVVWDRAIISLGVALTVAEWAVGGEDAEALNKGLVACRASSLLSQSACVSESRGDDVRGTGVVAGAVTEAVADAVAEVTAEASVEEIVWDRAMVSFRVALTVAEWAGEGRDAEALNKGLMACRTSPLLAHTACVSESRGEDEDVAGVVKAVESG